MMITFTRKTIFGFFLLAFSTMMLSQDIRPITDSGAYYDSLIRRDVVPRLIVRSDDMGAFHSVNVACIEALRNGIETDIELMVVTPWFPEAVRLLRENPGVDVGLHLTITSEWDNIKWRPLTPCPSLTDDNGYFYPMMRANAAYPGQSVTENNWDLTEVEQEFRAQIELGLKNVPQISHVSGHMGSTNFDPKVQEMARRLAKEYHLVYAEGREMGITSVRYDGPSTTVAEKESSFVRMLEKLEPGKNYLFLDHPALDNDEMQTVGHTGYENVAADRQGVTNTLTSSRVKQVVNERGIELINYIDVAGALPRSAPEAENVAPEGISCYLEAVEANGQELHSVMIVRHGKVVFERWFGEHAANKPHQMWSVSKTFTSTAIGFAVSENRLKVTDKVVSFFPDKLPAEVSSYLREMEIRHLLTMSTGNEERQINRSGANVDWVEAFLAAPMVRRPGAEFSYNSMATYMLAAILQKVTGEKLVDYLYPRLFRPLGITGVTWSESPQGVNIGGWGLSVKTEDMAKLGQFILQKGRWNDAQLLPEAWIGEATTSHIASLPSGATRENLTMKTEDSDWLQGYGYKIWRCRHNGFRADGANGQFIIMLPDQDAVIAITANISDMQSELNLIWEHLLPAMK